MNAATIKRFAADPMAFFESLVIKTGDGPMAFDDVMADFQRADFEVLSRALLAIRDHGRPTPARMWIERTKGGSKDSDLACALLWALAFVPRSLTCQVGAADADQADELRKAAKDLLAANAWLQARLSVQAGAIVNPSTESRADIIPADVAGSHGARPDILILNELSHVTKREFAENLLDNAAKIANSLVVIATNAGHTETWQARFRDMAFASDRWHCSTLKRPAPWTDAQELAEREQATSQNRFRRLWHGEWTSDTGDALNADDVRRAVTRKIPQQGAEDGFAYVVAVDIGLRKDATAMVTVGRHHGYSRTVPTGMGRYDAWGNIIPEFCTTHVEGTRRYRVCDVQTWKPTDAPGQRVNLESVRLAIVDVCRRFKPRCVLVDPYQGEHLSELLAYDGIRCKLVNQTGPQLNAQAVALVEAFQTRTIDVYDDADLLADLKRLQIKEKSYGVRLVSPYVDDADEHGTRHGDCASALSIALAELRGDVTKPRMTTKQLESWIKVI